MKKVNQIKLIKLLDLIFDIGDLEDLFSYDLVNYKKKLIDFGNKLSEVFSDEIDDEILANINTFCDSEKRLFLDEYDCEYDKNPIKIKIKSYLENSLYLDFDIISENLKFNNSYILKYLKPSDKKRVKELVDINEDAIAYMDKEDLTSEYLIERMKKSDFVSKCFGGFYGNNVLFENSLDYANCKELVELMEQQLLGYIKKDSLCYKNFSDLAKDNLILAEFAYKCEPLLVTYMTSKIRKLIEGK